MGFHLFFQNLNSVSLSEFSSTVTAFLSSLFECPSWNQQFRGGTRLSSPWTLEERNNSIPHLDCIAESHHLHYTTLNSSVFLYAFIKIHRNYDKTLHHLTVFNILKKMNGPNRDLRTHKKLMCGHLLVWSFLQFSQNPW